MQAQLAAEPQVDPDNDLRMWMREFADTHRRWGYKRALAAAREEGRDVGRDHFRRLWREEGLRVRPRKKSKRALDRTPTPRIKPAQCPRDVWALDFQFDSDYTGRAFKICNVIDEFTRQHIAWKVNRSITAKSVVELLDLAVLEHGAPRVLRMDNGPEFIAHALADWVAEQGAVQAFTPPGQPWHNGFVESLHNRMRDELLEDNLFDDIEHASKMVNWWSNRYNNEHPHSSLGWKTPNQFAKEWEAQQQTHQSN